MSRMPRAVSCVVVVFLVFLSSSACAEVFLSRPLPAGTFSLGLEPEIILSGETDFTLYLHGGVGLTDGYGIRLKLGIGDSPFNDDELQVGGMLDIALVPDGRGAIGLFLGLGGSTWGKGAFEWQLILHNDFGPLSLYGGLDGAARLANNDDLDFPLEAVIGIDVPFSTQMHLLMEGGIELHDSASFLSGGLRFYF